MCPALPVPETIYERAVLFDTGALVAITDSRDQYHDRAVACLGELRQLAYPWYITTLTIAETHRRLLYRSHLGMLSALDFLESIYEGSVNIARSTEADARQAMEYIKRFDDQDLTFTDAINMAVTKRLGLRRVFAFDWHFTLLGFLVIPPIQ
jgi:predicted nucleic acid-binding protein